MLQDAAVMLATSSTCEQSSSYAAAQLLFQIIRGLKRSLARAVDPMLVAHPASARSAAPEAAGQQGRPGASPTKLRVGSIEGTAVASAVAASMGAALGSPGHTQQGAAAQQQSVQYPQPLPVIPDHVARHGPELQRYVESIKALNVTTLAYSLALHLLPSLPNPQMHRRLLPLVEELMPLLLGSRAGSVPPVASQALQVRVALLLQPLAQALLANLSMARSESAGIVQVCQLRKGIVSVLASA
jgi:hypothetical protein